MEIRAENIKQVLEKLLNDNISREDASLWAYNLRQEADHNKLLSYMEIDEKILWESILLLKELTFKMNQMSIFIIEKIYKIFAIK